MKKKRVPNTVERGRRPDEIRVCWILETDEGDFHSGFTWGGIPNITKRLGRNASRMWLVDLKTNQSHLVTDIEGFLEEWAEHYWDYDWNLEECEYVI